MSLLRALHAQFWHVRDARPMGLLRSGWAAVVFVTTVMLSTNVVKFYTNAGVLEKVTTLDLIRGPWRGSLLDSISEPSIVIILHVTLLITAIFASLGLYPRFSTIITTLLFISFHERNPAIHGGGDSVLRILGVLLSVSPGIASVTLFRSIPPRHIPSWPQILLTWQMIIIYVSSAWSKLLGEAWRGGSAVATAVRHEHIARGPLWLRDIAIHHSQILGYTIIVFEFSWLLLLIPSQIMGKSKKRIIRRALLITGTLFHGSIFILLDVGSFSLAMIAAYAGLLHGEDIDWLRSLWRRSHVWRRKFLRGCIILFFFWHAASIGIYGIPTPKPDAWSTVFRSKFLPYIEPYLLVTSQWQLWDLFSERSLSKVVTYSIEIPGGPGGMRVESLDFHKLQWWRNQAETSFVRNITQPGRQALAERYLQIYCRRLGLRPNTSLGLRGQWFDMPGIAENTPLPADWSAWQPPWQHALLLWTRCRENMEPAWMELEESDYEPVIPYGIPSTYPPTL